MRDHGFAGAIDLEDYDVSADLTAEALGGIVDRSYHVGLLPKYIRRAVAEALAIESKKRSTEDGTVQFTLDMRFVTARIGKRT